MAKVMSAQPNFVEIEKELLGNWEKKNIFSKLQQKNRGHEKWSFLDGPITANNPMGVHHAWGRTYKDLFQRYKALRGYEQRYQNGFDCQGLWVEVEVEKELGFKSKKDIEAYGIAAFVEKCKERVLRYTKVQTAQSIRLGQWMDWENSYLTMSDSNNYAIWAFLKKCYQAGWLYKGHDVVPWCPRCGTSISQHEILAEEYQEVTHTSIYFRVPVKGRQDTYFLVWTTTPWTLPANVALAVHPEFTYLELLDSRGDTYIVQENFRQLVPAASETARYLGSKMAGVEYDSLFAELPAVRTQMDGYQPKVIMWEEVTSQEGTGIVHIAPGCGQEDYLLGREQRLAVIDPTDAASKYPEGFGEFSRHLVSDVAESIFNNLQHKGLLYKLHEYQHRYPTCWRCKSELIFRLVDEWYISMEQLRPRLMAVARKMTWLPDFGLERELDWLKNMNDWMISKKRYWGLALPIYECPQCGGFEVIGSKAELQARAVQGWDKFKDHSPHRPWVDEIKIKCRDCGQVISRVPDVGTPWLDAGIVPFSTLDYFQTKETWQQWYPFDFVCESFPGQFKNWFYALIVMSTVLENELPTKTVFGYASVRDELGEEMHKSKGNAIWFDQAVEELGADVMRWMYARQPIVNNLRFGYKTADEQRRRLLVLWHTQKFVVDSIGLSGYKPQLQLTGLKLSLLDRWVLSQYNGLLKKVTQSLDQYDVAGAMREIEVFLTDFSQWYIRRSRDRVGSAKTDTEAISFYETALYVLLNLLKTLSPIVPFMTDYMYLTLLQVCGQEGLASIHLENWPMVDEAMIDGRLEQEMAQVRYMAELGHAERKKEQLKVRQPLLSVSYLVSKEPTWVKNIELVELLQSELNVKEVKFRQSPEASATTVTAKLDTTITPDLQEEGEAREIIRRLQSMRKEYGCARGDKVDAYLPTWPKRFEQEIIKTAGLSRLLVDSRPRIEALEK